jgi:uncharacterized protein
VVFLLDVNVLVALAWPRHVSNEQVGQWFARHSRNGWATCPFTEAALVRILANPAFSPEALSVENALTVLKTNIELPGHRFLPDNISVVEAIAKVGRRLTGHGQITDAYLVGLALHHGGRLATMDRGVAAIAPKEALELIV